MSSMTWHQQRGAERALMLHRWIAEACPVCEGWEHGHCDKCSDREYPQFDRCLKCGVWEYDPEAAMPCTDLLVTITLTERGPGLMTGDYVLRIVTNDGRDYGPLGVLEDWRVDGYYADRRFAPSYARPPMDHARIHYGTSYSDVPLGSTVTVLRREQHD